MIGLELHGFSPSLENDAHSINETEHMETGKRESVASINPITGELIRECEPHTDAEIELRLCQAWGAFLGNRRVKFKERAARMMHAAELLERDKRGLAETMVLEMGKPIRAAVQEVEKCAWACEYFAENAERFLAEEPVATDASRSRVVFRPLGRELARQ